MSQANTENTGDTGQGFLVGTQPAQPRMASDWQGGTPAQQVTQQQPLQQPQPNGDPRPAYRWTDEDIENARKQEKDKLYGRIEDMGATLKELQAARDAEAAEKQRLADEAEAARKAKEESELDLRALMDRREQEMRSEVEKIRRAQETEREIFAKERSLQEAASYRRERIEQESEFLLPELRDFVQGDTPEAIDQSIEALKQRTAAIVANFVGSEPPPVPFQRMGASPTSPPVGPMEQMPSYESLTADDVRGMDMETYKRMRPQLLQATNPNRQQRRG